MSTLEITAEGSSESIIAFTNAAAELRKQFPGVSIELETLLERECPNCHHDVVGTTLEDGTVSFYCLECNTDLTGGIHARK
jgi:hypothetical protein